jgi:NADPH:quinone reductase-like Zn-dependent oxidoreductase
MRAAGQHFSAQSLPLDPSSDGVGIDEETGQAYYIGSFAAPTMAEYTNVDRSRVSPIPEGADSITVAALTNPVTSSWMALKYRVKDLPDKFSVLILGATSTSGRAAVTVSKAFGAGRVIGAGRSEESLKKVEGLDGHLVLNDEMNLEAAGVGHVDVVLDYIWGQAAGKVLAQLKPDPERGTTFVNIGTVAGDENLAVPAQLLRAKNLALVGAAPGSWPLQGLGKEVPELLKVVANMEKPKDVYSKPLKDIEAEWQTPDAKRKRLVLVP